MGVSENSVPLNPMVSEWSLSLLNGYFIGNIPYFQTNPYEILVPTDPSGGSGIPVKKNAWFFIHDDRQLGYPDDI